MRFITIALAVSAPVFFTTPVLAHAGAGATGLTVGFLHPFAGADHILAAIAVGLWAAQIGGRAVFVLPFVFVSLMIGGAVIGMSGIPGSGAESLALLSVVLLGGAVALAAKPAFVLSVLAVGIIAVVQGYAHGTEAPSASGGGAFLAGLLCATALLHLAGMAGYVGLHRVGVWAARGAGGLMALAGFGLAAIS